MKHSQKIYIPGHLGMVGSAIHRNLKKKGFQNFVFRSIDELDLTRQTDVEKFFEAEKPDYVFVAAAKVGGIVANNTYRAQFIYENLMIQNNIIHAAYKNGVKKLLFLGSSCIYPKNAPQPMKEDALLTGVLEQTNEPYAIAKIAGIKMCENYYRQFGCDFISVMPTNLYGPNDNYDLEKSHVLPALIRKMHLGKCLMNQDWEAIRNDFMKRPSGIVEKATSDRTIERQSDGTMERLSDGTIERRSDGTIERGSDGTIERQSEGAIERLSESEIVNILSKFGIHLQDHAITQSQDHSVTPSLPRSITPSPPHSVTPSLPRSVTPSPPCSIAISLWGTGKVYREFLHVEDMADACVYIMQNISSEKLYDDLKQTHINIGTGIDLTIRELAELVKKVTGFNGNLVWDQSKPDGTYKKQLDVNLLQSLGWKASIDLQAGIEQVYRNYVL
jgi:GDP-L-fucose synthase